MLKTSLTTLLALNVLSLAAYWLDKAKARRGTTRIPESRLLLFTFLGPLGSLVGVWWVRHKNRKLSYLLKYFLVLLLSVAGHVALAWLLRAGGGRG